MSYISEATLLAQRRTNVQAEVTLPNGIRHLLAFQLRSCLSQVLWECGGTLAAPAIAAGVIHKALAFIAPKLVGPPSSLGTVQSIGSQMVSPCGADALKWHCVCAIGGNIFNSPTNV